MGEEERGREREQTSHDDATEDNEERRGRLIAQLLTGAAPTGDREPLVYSCTPRRRPSTSMSRSPRRWTSPVDSGSRFDTSSPRGSGRPVRLHTVTSVSVCSPQTQVMRRTGQLQGAQSGPNRERENRCGRSTPYRRRRPPLARMNSGRRSGYVSGGVGVGRTNRPAVVKSSPSRRSALPPVLV